MVHVRVRMVGPLKEAWGRGDEELSLGDGADISSVICALIERQGEVLERALLDPVLRSPLPNALILLNGVEIHNIRGLSTQIEDGDVIALLSITHGG